MRLSIIYLEDRDVHNDLLSINKNMQIAHFCKSIVHLLDGISFLCQRKDLNEYICSIFGGQRGSKMVVLADYINHGFNGSGDEGGICIDR